MSIFSRLSKLISQKASEDEEEFVAFLYLMCNTDQPKRGFITKKEGLGLRIVYQGVEANMGTWDE